MNSNDRVIASYMLMCATGIDGSDADYVYEIVTHGIESKEPLLRQVAKIAKGDSKNPGIKEIVAGLTVGKALEYNKEAKVTDCSKKVVYTIGDNYFFCTVWQDKELLGVVQIELPELPDKEKADEYFKKLAKEKFGNEVEFIKA